MFIIIFAVETVVVVTPVEGHRHNPEYGSNKIRSEQYDLLQSLSPSGTREGSEEYRKVYNSYRTMNTPIPTVGFARSDSGVDAAVLRATELSATKNDAQQTTTMATASGSSITTSMSEAVPAVLMNGIDVTSLDEHDDDCDDGVDDIDDDASISPIDDISVVGEESTIRLKYRSPNDDDSKAIFPPLQTPIVYRYYPRHQSRTISAGSIPFVLLGPNVDHWKLVAQQLSSRGFNVIAVGPKDQILPSTTTSSLPSSPTTTYELGLTSSTTTTPSSSSSANNDRYLEGPGLVVQLLDSLRWKKIVLVGCDSEAALAIQAALLLPSDRIAGLILCGNVQNSESTFLGQFSSCSIHHTNRGGRVQNNNPLELDRFLHERLSCPFTIVWDGTNEHTSVSSTATTLDNVSIMSSSTISKTSSSGSNHHRSVVVGGGTSPHRRRPGIFAWILTRFVEERIAPAVSIQVPSTPPTTRTVVATVVRTSRIPPSTSSSNDTIPNSSIFPMWLSSLSLWKYPTRWIPVLWNVDDMFNEESMVVFGRIVATAIFYAISLKVLVYQYGNIRDGIDIIASTPQQIVHMFRNRISNVVSFVVFVVRIPFMILPFGKNNSQISGSSSNDSFESTKVEEESMIVFDEDSQEEQSDDEDDSSNQQEPKTDSDLRPFFFLDHVVA